VSSAAAGTAGPLPLTPAKLRLLPYLQTHLTAERIAERLFVSNWTVKTQVNRSTASWASHRATMQ